MKELPRGVRNRNPGNLRKTDDKWQGLADEQPDPEFFTFREAFWGIRALAVTLINYQDRYGLDTVTKIITRWAPYSENDTNAYIRDVAGRMGRHWDERLNVHRYEDLEPLVKAIIWHENGQQPYSQAVIDRGLVMAGVTPPAKPSGVGASSRIGLSGAAGASGIETIQTVLSDAQGPLAQLSGYLEIAKWAFLAVTLASIGFVIWRYTQDRKRGLAT